MDRRGGLLVACLVVVGACAGRATPVDNASRPLHVDLHVRGFRDAQVHERLQRLLVQDPAIGMGDGTTVHAHVLLPVCSIGFGIENEETSFGVVISGALRDNDDYDDCLHELLPSAVEMLRERLRAHRAQDPAPRRL